MALHDRSTMSVEEYLKLDESSQERYEFSDGYVYMLAGGSAEHAHISFKIATILANALPAGCRVYNFEMRVQISEERYVYPDVVVSCDPRDRGETKTVQTPLLVVEVLSPSTEVSDRTRKLNYYRSHPTIGEYMLVNTRYPLIEVYSRGRNHKWIYDASGPGTEVELPNLGVRFPVEAVYNDVEFPPEEQEQL